MDLWVEPAAGEDERNHTETWRTTFEKNIFLEYEEGQTAFIDGRNTSLDNNLLEGQALSSYLAMLAITMILSLAVNLSLLMVFARKESLRTTSNTLIINLLLVNVSSTLLLLPLAALDTMDTSMASATVQCFLSQAVNQVVSSFSFYFHWTQVLSLPCLLLDSLMLLTNVTL